MDDLCELAHLTDIGRLYDVKHALEARGIEAGIWGDWIGGRRYAGSRRTPRLMIRRRDLVYARWVACAAGLDPWPDEPGEDEGGAVRARPSPSDVVA